MLKNKLSCDQGHELRDLWSARVVSLFALLTFCVLPFSIYGISPIQHLYFVPITLGLIVSIIVSIKIKCDPISFILKGVLSFFFLILVIMFFGWMILIPKSLLGLVNAIISGLFRGLTSMFRY